MKLKQLYEHGKQTGEPIIVKGRAVRWDSDANSWIDIEQRLAELRILYGDAHNAYKADCTEETLARRRMALERYNDEAGRLAKLAIQ